MSVDLYMKSNKTEEVVNLGGSYFFKEPFGELELKFDEIEKELRYDIVPSLKSRLLSKVLYKPKDYEEMKEVVQELEEDIEYYVEMLLMYGRCMALSIIADNSEGDIEFFEK